VTNPTPTISGGLTATIVGGLITITAGSGTITF
jgi:hypothetical protein